LKFLLRLLALLVLVAAAAAGWLWYGLTQPYRGFPNEGVFVDVPHGAASRSVGRLLQSSGVIRNAMAFELYARRKSTHPVQAGEYFFDHALSARDVFWKLAKGEVYEQPFAVKEGDTMFDIAAALEKAGLMSAAQFLAAAKNPALVHDIAPTAPTLEGFLFPATYHLSRHPAATDLTAEMVRKFREEWAAAKAALPAAASTDGTPAAPAAGTPQEPAPGATTDTRPVLAVVTLASLVERETPRSEERPLIAGTFTNRLQRGMALQCDPTVVYAMEREHKYHGSLSGKDLKFDSPYNTYEHAGLPPGPIANPGEPALRAALEPAKTDYLYFVANTHGGHFFAGTLAEHNRNVLKYRRLLGGPDNEPPPAPVANAAAGHRKGGGR
jgi:UPF0755 protein